jgi:long-chain fatty acid transport protein
MNNPISSVQLSRLCLALAFASTSSLVQASGFALIEQSASGQGLSYAGAAASTEDASVMWFNPAGLSKIKNPQFIAGLHLLLPDLSFTDDGTSTASGPNDSAGTLGAVPNFYYARPLDDKTTLGFGVNVPFGQHIEYAEDWVGRYQATNTDVNTVNFNLNFARQLTPKLSAGLGLNVLMAQLVLEQKMPNPSPFNADTDKNIAIEANAQDYGWNAGLLYDLSEKTVLGLGYRSKITLDADGDITITTPDLLEFPGQISSRVVLPASWNLSMTHQLNPQWQLLADAQLSQWSQFDSLIIDTDLAGRVDSRQNLKDAWRYALGTIYQMNDQWKIRTGLALDTSAVSSPEGRSPRTPDSDRLWYSAGFGYQWKKNLRLDTGFTYIQAEKAKVNYTTDEQSYLVGEYDNHVWIASAQLVWDF